MVKFNLTPEVKAEIEVALDRLKANHAWEVNGLGMFRVHGSLATVFLPVHDLREPSEYSARWTWGFSKGRRALYYACPGCNRIYSPKRARIIEDSGFASGCMECRQCGYAIYAYFHGWATKRKFFKKSVSKPL